MSHPFDPNATGHALAPHLEFTVPLKIMELQARGGPTDFERARLPFAGRAFAERGDILLYRTADPRDARLNLKQLTIRFPAGTTQAQATTRAGAFATATKAIQGCGTVEKVAGTIGAEVVDNDTVRIRDLPGPLQDIMLKLQVGQSTPPFGSAQDGVRALVLCGRDDPKAGTLPGAEQVQSQLEGARVNLRAQQKLRDLRRDAVIEYR